ncbi:tetratricopeptide (TPR) repeat protein [Rhodopseudomonas rhenobacensis]|uniref:Tetratricopeptide (TPR) repeat protein n=1 Tax=Rhodopseudomonas rhenobacensis TaxID=87461 RepID=A0A7W7Z5D9_9BRAD|nr:caspase family protein [Rhodopseudomonas rhenobacensis]MBB5048326.1 tetratricopeptide (TPR) repeat protein [Rhodopseudomonas rhenobacensis]
MRIGLALVAILSLAMSPLTAWAAEPGARVALVIGNAKYPDSDRPLKEPINDARELGEELKRAGFDVEVGENLGGEAMRRAFDRLYDRVKPGSVALLFFSGFGIQSNRQSYLIPVDAQIWTEPDVRRDGVSLETVLGEIHSRGAGIKVALLDASRRNPFERRFRSFSAGLAPVIAPNGSLVMYSAALSSVVSDNGGEHGLFVAELLKALRAPAPSVEDTLNRTRLAINRASKSEQVPWVSSSLTEEFSLAPRPTVALNAPPLPPSIEPPTPAAVPAQPAPIEIAKPAAPPPAAKPPEQPAAAPQAAPDGNSSELALAEDPTIKALSDKLADNPEDANALYRRGQVYASKGAYALAVQDFDATIKLNPRDVEAYNNRCWVRTVIGDLTAALKDCNEALRLRPNFADALDSRGLVNLKNGQTKNAIADFDAALKIDPRLTSSLYGRGLAKQRNGAAAEGDLDVANAKAMDPNIVQEFAGYGVR